MFFHQWRVWSALVRGYRVRCVSLKPSMLYYPCVLFKYCFDCSHGGPQNVNTEGMHIYLIDNWHLFWHNIPSKMQFLWGTKYVYSSNTGALKTRTYMMFTLMCTLVRHSLHDLINFLSLLLIQSCLHIWTVTGHGPILKGKEPSKRSLHIGLETTFIP